MNDGMPWSGTPEEQKEKRRLYNLKNKEEQKEKARLYYLKNKEKIKQYRDENKEKIEQRDKQYRETPASKKSKRISQWKGSGVIHNDFNELYEKYITTELCEECNCVLTYDSPSTKTTKCLDHDHQTGLFRNVICNACNVKRR